MVEKLKPKEIIIDLEKAKSISSIQGWNTLSSESRMALVMIVVGGKPAAELDSGEEIEEVVKKLGLDFVKEESDRKSFDPNNGKKQYSYFISNSNGVQKYLNLISSKSKIDKFSWQKEFGHLMGFPECCIEEFLKGNQQKFLDQIVDRLKNGLSYPDEFNYLPNGFCPCSIDCSASKEMGKRFKLALTVADSNAAAYKLKQMKDVLEIEMMSEPRVVQTSEGIYSRIRALFN